MNFTSRSKRLLVVGVAAGALSAGGAGIAFAATGSPTAAATDQGEHDPSYQSSVRAPEKDYPSDAAEQAALAKLATITPDQAKQSAAAATRGTATGVELGNENGNVIYLVDLTTPAGPAQAAVDAGNGHVLAQQGEAPDSGKGDGQQADAPDAGQGADQAPGAPAPGPNPAPPAR